MSPTDMARLRRSQQQADAFRTSDVARLANEIQAAGESSRTAALQEAERLQVKYGTGLTLAGVEKQVWYIDLLRRLLTRAEYAERTYHTGRALRGVDTFQRLADAGYCLDRPDFTS